MKGAAPYCKMKTAGQKGEREGKDDLLFERTGHTHIIMDHPPKQDARIHPRRTGPPFQSRLTRLPLMVSTG